MNDVMNDLTPETLLVSFEFFGTGAVYYIEGLPAGYVYIGRDEKEKDN